MVAHTAYRVQGVLYDSKRVLSGHSLQNWSWISRRNSAGNMREISLESCTGCYSNSEHGYLLIRFFRVLECVMP